MLSKYNTDIVLDFINDIYNKGHIRRIERYVHPDCIFGWDDAIVANSVNELKAFMAYVDVDKYTLYSSVTYRILHVIQNKDFVSVLVSKEGIPLSTFRNTMDMEWVVEDNYWEMFQLREGKIVSRWTAES